MIRLGLALAMALVAAAPALARQGLGLFDGWAAFRDAAPPRCYAIGEPEETRGARGPFATISWWPPQGVKGQVHFRLRFARAPGSDVMLLVGTRLWRLKPGERDAWSPSPLHDAYILAKIRQSRRMTIRAVARNGGRYSDSYSLKGAATAIDAAALSCARPA